MSFIIHNSPPACGTRAGKFKINHRGNYPVLLRAFRASVALKPKKDNFVKREKIATKPRKNLRVIHLHRGLTE